MKNVQEINRFDLDKAFPPPLELVLLLISFVNQERHEEWIPMFNCGEYVNLNLRC